MIAFDMLTLVSTPDCITYVDPAAFTTEYKEGATYRLKMTMKSPFYLHIEVNYQKGEMKMEFSGKVLGERYPELINLNTIKECFKRINDLGFIEIDADKMMSAQVMKCDVTKDVAVTDIPSLTRFIRGHIRNYHSYNCKPHKNGNTDIFKNVDGKDYQRWLTIYDKQKEMMRKAGQKFAESYGLEGKHDGLCRFEMKLTSQQAIRDALDITGTTLAEVLCSERNPIADFLDDVIQQDTTANTQDTWKTYWQTLVLEDCDYDIGKVEHKLREYKNGGISKALQPFRDIVEAKSTGSSKWTKARLLDLVR